MNTVELYEKDIKLSVPEHWDEMNADDLGYCLKQAVLASIGLITPEEAKIRAMFRLLDIKRDWRTVMWERIQSAATVREKNANMYLLSEQLMGFMFRPVEGKAEVNYETVMNHFPVVRAGRTKLHGPAHLLSDLTYGEFRAALEEMGDYFESQGKDQHLLSRMIACLYRPERVNLPKDRLSKEWDGKIQEPFNRARIEDHAKLTAKLGLVHRTAILLWFTYSISYIQKRDLMIGGRTINLSLLFPEPTKGEEKKKGAGFTGILYSVAETGIFGNAAATDQVGLFDILIYLYDKDIETRRAKAKAQAQKVKKS